LSSKTLEWLSSKEGAILIALLFLGFLLYSRTRRRKDLAWIKRRFPGQEPVVTSFRVIFWGQEPSPSPVRKRTGVLLLLPDRIFFRGGGGYEWEVSGPQVTGVDHDSAINGENLNQSVMIVQFDDQNGQATRAAFRVPYPPQWMKAIEVTLINQPQPSGA
jgi:hypothetical protein